MIIALGGNALLRRGESGTIEEQRYHVRSAVLHLEKILGQGHRVVITHGNGPQIGDILLKDECASGTVPRMPLDVCGAESQGMIGYLIQQELGNALPGSGGDGRVISVICQTVVDRSDPALNKPEKPIGPFYSGPDAERLREMHGWTMHEIPGQGFRRVVPSPAPVGIVEGKTIRALFEEGHLVIAAGGGGIPVTRGEHGELAGVEAVIDKDLTAALLGGLLGCDMLLILTDVPYAYTGFGTSSQAPIEEIDTERARAYLDNGEFHTGSMAPKIEACIRFIGSGGRCGIITTPERAELALSGKAGTRIVRRKD